MTRYNVHIYRELRLTFVGIEASSPEQAATIARDLSTPEAVDIDDCEGETFAALVDVDGDEQHEQSRVIDFEPERLRQAALDLWEALESLLVALDGLPITILNGPAYDALSKAQAALAKVKGPSA